MGRVFTGSPQTVLKATQNARNWSVGASKIAAFVAITLALSSCANVIQTTSKIMGPQGQCNGAMGSYHLSHTMLKATVKTAIESQEIKSQDRTFEIKAMPRLGRNLYCLEFLDSQFHSDDIRVLRSVETDDNSQKKSLQKNVGLLQVITNKTTDFSGVILRKIVRTIFTAISGKPGFTPVPGRVFIESTGGKKYLTELELEFDPLDPHDLANANDQLASFGVCVSLGSYSFDEKKATINDYCNAPGSTATSSPSKAPELVRPMHKFPSNTPGIFYRPKLNYSLSIYSKKDPSSGDPWRLSHSERLGLENLSPVFSLGVNRTLFSQQRTALIFNDGILDSYCTTKGSEALGAIEIPLEVVRSMVALPTQILQVQVDEVQAQQQLDEATSRTVALQNALLKKELDPDFEFTPATLDDTSLTLPQVGETGDFAAPTSPPITGNTSLLKNLCSKSEIRDDSGNL